MSAKTTSTALAAIFMLGAAPLLAQTASDAPPVEDSAPAASDTTGDAQAPAGGETAAPAEAEAPATEAPATETPAAEAPATDAPATEAPATAETPEGEAPAAEAPAATEAPADGTPPEPQVGAYYPRATHGDWTLRCIRTADGADPCELYQLMKDGQGNSVAEITMIPLQNGGQAVAGATIVTPLETDLTQGIGMQIDSGEMKGYPFNFCAPVGCVSRIGLTADELARLKRGNAATVSVLPYGGTEDQIVSLKLSLTGFTAGYGELETAVAEMREAVAASESAQENGAAQESGETPDAPAPEAPAQ